MKHGRHSKHGKHSNRRGFPRFALALIAIVLLTACVVGGVVAFLADKDEPVVNTFTPQQTSIDVGEEFDCETKKNVTVANTCQIPVFVRVKLVPTWENDKGETVGVAASLADLNITLNTTDWTKIGDYYYYNKPVAVGASTTALVTQATVVTQNDYIMNLQVLAECIQAEGEKPNGVKPVQEAWKVTIADGSVTPYSAG